MKLTLWFVLAASTLILLIGGSRAAEYLITCDHGGCSSGGQALFNDAVVAPGNSVTRSLEINNTDDEQINVNVNAGKESGSDEDFLPYVSLLVQDVGGPIRYSGNVAGFFSQTVDLGAVAAGKVKAINFTLSLADVPNEYQGKKIKFKLPINLSVPGGPPGEGDDGDDDGTGGPSQTVAGASTSSTKPGFSLFGFGGQVAGLQTGPDESPDPSISPSSETGAGILGEAKQTNWYWWLLLLIPLIWLLNRLRRRFSHH